MKKWLFTVLFGSALVLGACGGGGDDGASDEPADNGDTATGEPADNGESEGGGGTVDAAAAQEVFESNCASCHGADLSGGAGPDLTKVGSRLSKEEIADTIKNGTDGGMPAGMATGDDVDLLASWLSQKK